MRLGSSFSQRFSYYLLIQIHMVQGTLRDLHERMYTNRMQTLEKEGLDLQDSLSPPPQLPSILIKSLMRFLLKTPKRFLEASVAFGSGCKLGINHKLATSAKFISFFSRFQNKSILLLGKSRMKKLTRVRISCIMSRINSANLSYNFGK